MKAAREIFDCEQGTPEWLELRAGMPTASMFGTVMASGRDGGESKTRQKYIYQLAGERLSGLPRASYSNADMERGKRMEPEARRVYAFECLDEVKTVGFIRRGRMGCSPDGLVGAAGGVEFKTTLPELLIEILFKGPKHPVPPEHMPQLQGNLFVAELEWIDLMIFWPGMPPFKRRVARDEMYIRRLATALDAFNDELDAVVERLKRLGAVPAENILAGG